MTVRTLLPLVALALVNGAVFAETKTVTLDVPGMTCPTCPLALRKVLLKRAGVSAVAVRYEQKQLAVIYNDREVTAAALTEATASIGFPSTVHAEQSPARGNGR